MNSGRFESLGDFAAVMGGFVPDRNKEEVGFA